jgi:HlyD family secretion protein
VDVGQTVAARMSAPTLFVLAADLTRMRLNASIDESDVGRIAAGQLVRFTVDAFPSEPFTGKVAQVRLSPTVTQNVVTYQTIIDVPNTELKLRPGMTANVTVETRRRDDVLRASNATLRFKPTTEMFALLGQAAPGAVSGTGNATSAGKARFSLPAPSAGTAGRAWVLADGALTPIDVRLGVSDGTYTEIVSLALTEGTELVWGVAEGSKTKTKSAVAGTANPFLGTQPRMPMGPPPPGPPPGV